MSTALTQAGLPALRQEMAGFYSGGDAPRMLQASFIEDGYAGAPVTPDDAYRLFTLESLALKRASLFALSDPMFDLADEASRTMESVNIQAEDMPSGEGLLLLPRTLRMEIGEQHMSIRAILWHTIPGEKFDHLAAISLSDIASMPVSDADNSVLRQSFGTLMHHDETVAAFDFPLSFPRYGDGPNERGYQSRAIQFLYTVWMLMRQNELTTVTPTKAYMKHPKKPGKLQRAEVSVVDMRRYERQPSEQSGERREHDHRWIVAGHWRNHWYPKQGTHKPRWIAAHIKGPDGAPINNAEKVYALRTPKGATK